MSSGTVLIVDSDTELAQIVSSYLTLNGYRVHVTKKAREAIGKIAMQKYSCIFLDPDLGDEDGADVLIAARDPAGLNSRTPFVIMSRSTSYTLRVDAISSVKAALEKPFELDDFISAFATAVSP